MKFACDKQESYTIFSVTDPKLNSLNAPTLKTELTLLNNEGIRNIILDINGVTFVDSSGLSAILVGRRLCENSNGTFVLSGANDNVLRLLRISQLESVLNLIPTLQEARDYVMMDELMRELGDNEEEKNTDYTDEEE